MKAATKVPVSESRPGDNREGLPNSFPPQEIPSLNSCYDLLGPALGYFLP